jgi:hypothetical protein
MVALADWLGPNFLTNIFLLKILSKTYGLLSLALSNRRGASTLIDDGYTTLG